MKEYICKEELKNWIYKNIEEPNGALKITVSNNQIDELPTVTKADICREFYNECIEREEQLADLNLTSVDIKDVMFDRLAEMESEE